MSRCLLCNKEFQPNTPQQKYCSEQCRLKQYRETRMSNIPVLTKICPICNTEFQTTMKHKKYCSKTCQHKSRLRTTDYRPPRKLMPVRGICYNCYKKFKPTFPTEKFCSDDCRLEYFSFNQRKFTI